jgi:altronate hydrolase
MDLDPDAPAVMRLSPRDNVAVALCPLKAGETVALDGVTLKVSLGVAVGQKLAAQAIDAGESILKYGCPIGISNRAIAAGEPLDARNFESRFLPTCAPPA